MPVYEYQAKTVQGMLVKGKMEAPNQDIVASNLRSKNYYPINIKQFNKAMDINLDDYIGLSMKDISIFCRQFSVIISAGISIMRGLEIVKEQTENKKLKKILNEVYRDVQKGQNLSDTMRKHKDLPEMLVDMVEVGETGGTLDAIMLRMADYYEKEFKLNQKIKQAMTYPICICVFGVLVVILLVVKVLPKFIEILGSMGNTKLPLPTRIVIGTSNFVRTKGIFLLIGIAILVVAFKKYYDTDSGRNVVDDLLLKMPIIGKINNKVITSRFASTFGMLMSSGVPVIQCLDTCCGVIGNVVIGSLLRNTMDEISKGISMGEALESKNIFPPMLTQMIKIGEESGTMDSILDKTAQFYDNEVETATSQLTTIIEPIIIALLAVVVGFIILSVMMPMFQMYNTMSDNA